MHAGQACVVKEDNVSERVYTIREGDTLVLQCLVTGHPRPQVSPALALAPCVGPELGRPRSGDSAPQPQSHTTGRGNCWKMTSVGKGWTLGSPDTLPAVQFHCVLTCAPPQRGCTCQAPCRALCPLFLCGSCHGSILQLRKLRTLGKRPRSHSSCESASGI